MLGTFEHARVDRRMHEVRPMGAVSHEHEVLPPVPIARENWWRATCILLATILACAAALYVVGMNLFLGTWLFRNAVNKDPDALRVEYTSAYSILPG